MAAFIIIDPVNGRRWGLRIYLQPPHEVVECSSFRESLTTCARRAFKAAFIVWPEGVAPDFADSPTWSCEHLVLIVSDTAQAPKGHDWSHRVLPQVPITLMRYPGGNYTFQEISRAVSRVLDAPAVSVPELVGSSPAMRQLMELAARLATTDRPVLITGEPGTGKEALARWLHARSERSQRPFETFDCAGLEPTMAVSELFGHEKGAFPWATQANPGLLAGANGGTLYIREVCDLDLALQNRLLHLLDGSASVAKRLGGQEPHLVDVRIIASSSRPLSERLGEEFSRHLYNCFRPNYPETPCLRARPSDIPELIKHFLARQHGAASRGCRWEPPALLAMQSYQWPGNLDELEEVVAEAALKVGPGGEMKLDHLPPRIRNAAEQAGLHGIPESAPPRRPPPDGQGRAPSWPQVGFECDGYTMQEIISNTDRARVFLAERKIGRGFCVAKFSQSRNKKQREALEEIMKLPSEDPKAKDYMIPIFHANNCPGDEWFMVVLDRLDDARTGRKIDRGGCHPHTLGEWITQRHWSNPPDGHDNWAVIRHIGAILRALHYFHVKGLVMNDAKPDNFGFYEGRLVAIDFGGFAHRGVPPHEYDLAYSPPEPREGQPAEDIYAVAVMLGEALYNLAPESLVPPRVPGLAEPYLKEKRLFDKLAWNILATGLNIFRGIRYQDSAAMLKDLDKLNELREEEENAAEDEESKK
jgi:hypothetical protein